MTLLSRSSIGCMYYIWQRLVRSGVNALLHMATSGAFWCEWSTIYMATSGAFWCLLKQFETILFPEDNIEDIYKLHWNIIDKSTGVT